MERMQPIETFKSMLQERCEDTYTKWYYNMYVVPYGASKQSYTAKESDILTCVAIAARKVTTCK